MRRETGKAHDVVFWLGDRGDTLYLVDHGAVAITAPDVRGEHVVLDTLVRAACSAS